MCLEFEHFLMRYEFTFKINYVFVSCVFLPPKLGGLVRDFPVAVSELVVRK